MSDRETIKLSGGWYFDTFRPTWGWALRSPDGRHHSNWKGAEARAFAAALHQPGAVAGEIAELSAKATGGPWSTHLVDDTTIIAPDRTEIATTCDSANTEREDGYNIEYERMEADAAFIVALVNAFRSGQLVLASRSTTQDGASGAGVSGGVPADVPWGACSAEDGLLRTIPDAVMAEFEREAQSHVNLWAPGVEAARQAFQVAVSRAWLGGLQSAARPKPPAVPAPGDEVRRMSLALERDRSIVAEGITALRKVLEGRAWLREGGRGSYSYDDERYQQEFGHALDEIETAIEPLCKVARDWTDCPRDTASVREARAAVPAPGDGGAAVDVAGIERLAKAIYESDCSASSVNRIMVWDALHPLTVETYRRRARAVIRALNTAPDRGQREGWRPIETAPKGEVLVADLEHVYAARLIDAEWYEVNNDPSDQWGGPIFPTHWMPLPAPPATQPEQATTAETGGEG